jgi:hypothetical protein
MYELDFEVKSKMGFDTWLCSCKCGTNRVRRQLFCLGEFNSAWLRLDSVPRFVLVRFDNFFFRKQKLVPKQSNDMMSFSQLEQDEEELRGGPTSGADKKKQVKRKQLAIKGPWSKEEDDVVVRLVNQYGPKRWSLIASNLPGAYLCRRFCTCFRYLTARDVNSGTMWASAGTTSPLTT